MKVYQKVLVVAGLCVSMALGLTGCGSKPLDGTQVAATVGEKEVTLGEANFLLRYQQVQMESYYESMLGEGIYEMDLYGDGTTFGTGLKSDIMTQMQEYYILDAKAADYGVALTDAEKTAITEAATAFIAANSDETVAQMNADQATVEKILTFMTLRTKMVTAIYAEADVTVTDEEAAQRGFSYISVSKGSGDSAMTDEEIQENKTKLAAVAEAVRGGDTMEGAAVAQEMTAYTGSYGKDTTSYDELVLTALDALEEGEVSEIVETESSIYLLQVTADLDEEATASRKESLIATAQSEYYNELVSSWIEEYPLTVVEEVWEQVKFDRSYELITE